MLTLCNVHQSCIGKDSSEKKKYGCISSVITFNYEKKYGCIYSVMCVIGKTILIRPVSFQRHIIQGFQAEKVYLQVLWEKKI